LRIHNLRHWEVFWVLIAVERFEGPDARQRQVILFREGASFRLRAHTLLLVREAQERRQILFSFLLDVMNSVKMLAKIVRPRPRLRALLLRTVSQYTVVCLFSFEQVLMYCLEMSLKVVFRAEPRFPRTFWNATREWLIVSMHVLAAS
jgi:hypothetical protein